MANKILKIVGRIVDSKTKNGIAGLRVEAWDKDLRVKEVIGSAVTDAKGSFQIEFEEAPFRKLFLNRKPLLSFKVFRGDQLAPSTEAPVLWDGDKPDSEVSIKVILESLKPPAKFTVSGEVRRADGSVFLDGFVQALITIQGQQRILGETKPDAKGRFEIAYTLDAAQLTQLANARIVARVFDSKKILLAESPALIPDKGVTVKLTIPNLPPVKTLSVQGRVFRQLGNSGSPVANAIVRAFITTPEKEIPLGEAKTDSFASYAITFGSDQIPPPPANANLQARVVDIQGKILAAASSPIKDGITKVDLVIPMEPPDEPGNVHGQVRQANGKPLDVGTVRIFGVVPGSEQFLGETTITKNDEGRYRFNYQPGATPKPGDGARIVVRVFDNQDQLLVSSAVVPAELDATVDLTMSGNVAEPFVVRGQVTRSGAGGNANCVVRIFGMSGGQESKLAPDAITDDRGRYEISYEAGEFNTTVNPSARVIVRVFDRQEKALVSSEPFNAQPVKVIDLVTPPPVEEQTLIVRGQVQKSDGAFFAGGAARAFHEAATGLTLLGEDTTNGEGRYTMSYSSKKVTAPINLRVQVFDANGNLLVQSDLIAGAKREETVNLTIPIAEKVKVVKGQVVHPDSKPFVKAIVQAHDRDLRSEQLLGRAVTDNSGHYEISYTSSQFARTEKESADLVVRAYKDERAIAANEMIASSPIVFNAKEVETVDLVVGNADLRGPSEWEQIEVALRPLLEGVPPTGTVQVATLTDEDTAFLAGETGLDLQHISFFVAAAKLGKTTGLAAEIFYGFAREKLPTTLNLLLAENADTQRRALEAAISESIIPASVGATIESVLDSLKKLVVQQAFAKPSEPGKTSLGALIGTALANTAHQTELVTRYVNHTGTIEEFWDGLRKDPVYAASVDELQFTLQLGALTANHLPLVSALRQMRTKKEFQSMRDLVRLEVEDWKKLLEGKGGAAGTGFPPEVPGADNAEKATNYATILTRMMRDAFPTAAVAHAVSGDNISGKADLTTFFTNNVAFDLGTTHIDKYLADNERTALSRVSDPAALTQQLKSFQRVHRLAPEYEQMRDLLGENLHSAQAISRIGETAFVNRFGPAWGANQAQLVFANAVQTATTALMLFAEYDSAFNSVRMAVLGTNGQPAAGIPNLETLFGSLDLCDCEHCRTVLSPAAYLVDILAFLKDRKSTITGKSAKDILFQRRPDLGQIELTCENTNAPLPYVDLVTELLEDCVSPPAVPKARQTTGTIAELMANPQFLNQGAYNKLKTEVFPWSLPFDLASDEVHAYLDHLGVPRHELMRTFQKPGATPDPTDAAIAADFLGLSNVERQIITATLSPQRKPWEFWGYPAASPGAWLTELTTVRLFLDRSGLSYEELTELLKAKFINPNPGDPGLGIVIVSANPLDPGTCDPEKLRIANELNNLSNAQLQSFLDRVHRFVRLWRRLGWTARELDKAISALQGALPVDQRLNDGFLLSLAHIQRLRVDFQLSIEQLLPLWASIDMVGEASLYKKLFQNPAVLKPLDENFQPNTAESELKIVASAPADAKISRHSATILAALRLSAAELATLTTNTVTGVTVTDDLLNLANLSRLYRASLLAKGVKLSIQDTLTLRVLTGVDPFDVANTANTLRFAELAAKMRASGFSIAELDYLLRHNVSSISVAPPTEARVALVLDEIRQGLQEIDDDFALRSSLVKQKLSDALNLDSNIIDQLLTQRIKSRVDPTKKSLHDFLAPAFADSDLQVHLTAAAFPDQFQTFTLLHKVALVLTKLRVTVSELTWLFDYSPSVSWLDLNALPLATSSASPAVLFAGWARLVDLFELRDQLPLGESVLSEVFSNAHGTAPDRAALLARLSVGASWNLDDLRFLDGITSFSGFNFSFPSAYRDERALVRLKACFVLMRRLGASAKNCFAWAKADLTLDDAASVKQTAKAKYDDAQWLAIAKPLRDVVREKQRRALVAYLVTHPDSAKGQTWKDVNGLFGYFLIDVEMSPCQLTSRIKQAISSVQLFVQRCLMNLEPSVVANAQSDTHWLEWKWMKNYRVWEANRKIFLYPENWIEPDLRDGKSPFFKDLESDLLQNEVTLEAAESALLTYVEKLDAVAHLEIVGIYDQQETDRHGNKVVDILHVFGRTRNSPHLYHYRQRVDSAYWTPWEKVDLDIEGDHLFPVVWNRRLCVFWPIFTEKSRPDTRPGASEKDTIKFWEIQIAWSEFKNKKWTAKRISKAVVETPTSFNYNLPKEQFTFKGLFTNGNLAIRIYTYFVMPTEGKGDVPQTIPQRRPFAEFSFAGCNSEPVVVPREALTNVAPLVVPLGSIPTNMKFVEEWQNPTWGRDGARAPMLEQKLNLVEGNFPISLTSASASTFENSRKNVLTLNKTPGVFSLLTAHQDRQFTAQRPFFFQDDRRVFLVLPEEEPFRQLNWSQPGKVRFESVAPILAYYRQPVPVRNPVIAPAPGDLAVVEPSQEVELVASSAVPFNQVNILPLNRSEKRYRFQTFYHPYICPLLRELNRNGIDGLLQRPAQITPHNFLIPPQAFNFNASYQPEQVVAQPYPVEDVDFSYSGAYSSYNWELFFHVPLLIADRLSKNQRFEEAQKWFHYVFDPTDTSGYSAPQKFWRTRRFFEASTAQYRNEKIQEMLQRLAAGTPDPEVNDQIKQWRQHPFNPHLIARLRTTAYQKSVVMKYLDNLIAWGDQLFSRDTIETINEATQLYILAAGILGRRPESIKTRITPPAHTFNTLEPLLNDFSNALVQVENVVAIVPNSGTSVIVGTPPPLRLPSTLFFCVPKNDKLLGYWDTVADRLFKIRHCMNIEGVVRQLPLFEPPIDPALLVRAAAAGLDISSALNDINAAMPHYRFNVMAQKTGEVCAELKALGGALLAALEKRDAEAVALLRSAQEVEVLNAVRQVRQRQVDEAKEALEGLKKSRDVVAIRRDYYANIQFLNAEEKAHLDLSDTALEKQNAQAQIDLVLNILALFPNLKFGAPTTLGTTFGGDNLAAAGRAFSSYLGATANILHTRAGLSATLGGHKRRSDDWKLQERMANKELEQIDKQILAGEIRLAIAEHELRNHDLQVENARDMDAFLHDKFTNRELYDWMVSQISGIYFQSYQLTYDLAKRAERAYRFELGLTDSNFIRFGYWDSLRKGLLAGERLSHDLKRMEAAYLDLSRREFELTKHISLALLDPLALIKLRETGKCFFQFPEEIFDLDYPGHYFRRIKSVSLTLPCVTGPYTTISCTLRLLNSEIRITTDTPNGYAHNSNGGLPADDTRFIENNISFKAIAASSAQNDAGVFELNFRDERYLPFEGAGAISGWSLELFTDPSQPDFGSSLRQFDYRTISDAIVHVKYTAREDAGPFKVKATENLRTYFREDEDTPSLRMLDLRQEFPSQWHRFVTPTIPNGPNIFEFEMSPSLFQMKDMGKTLKINSIWLLARCTKPDDYKIVLTPPPLLAGSNSFSLAKENQYGGLHVDQKDVSGLEVGPTDSPVPWQLQMTRPLDANLPDANLEDKEVEDLIIVLGYQLGL